MATGRSRGRIFSCGLAPACRAQLTQRLGLSASLGVAGAYTGSTYSVIESFAAPDSGGAVITTPDPEKSSTSEFLSGYYADINLDWAVSERTGFFGGLVLSNLATTIRCSTDARHTSIWAIPSVSEAASASSSERGKSCQHGIDVVQLGGWVKQIDPRHHLLHQSVRAGGATGNQDTLGGVFIWPQRMHLRVAAGTMTGRREHIMLNLAAGSDVGLRLDKKGAGAQLLLAEPVELVSVGAVLAPR